MAATPIEVRPRVLLVDDHELLLSGLRQTLERSGGFEIVGEATRASQVMPLVRREHPDVVLLDIRLAEVDGLVCLDEIKANFPEIKVIVLSAFSDPVLIDDAMKRGASGYVVKSVQPVDLPALIRRTVEDDEPLLTLAAEHEAVAAAAAVGLTPREFAMLTALAKGMTNDAIGKHLTVAPQTVKFHLTNVYRKLGVGNRTEAALYAYQHGLVESPHPGVDREAHGRPSRL
jgi:DNA-binding NarL/FixJ family response regulator